MSKMTPRKIVNELNSYIVGQHNAKKAVAIALRNRWRRMQLNENLRYEVTPKNILMIGPTGVGKTEIARRLAKLADAPFIKVEATKFTEVGYVGKEVDSIIRDLIDSAVKTMRVRIVEKNRFLAEKLAEARILDILIPSEQKISNEKNEKNNYSRTKKFLLRKLRSGKLNEKKIEINLSVSSLGVEIMAPPGMEEMTNQLQSIFKNIIGRKKKQSKIKIKEAMKILIEEESNKLINPDKIKEKAVHSVEQSGIVFIDEIDKVCRSGEVSGTDISREGVQRDLLPLVEGCTVSTKYGSIKTDHILFIASGAFQIARPSDLIPELQGRLPIKVELKALTVKDFEKILTEPHASLTTQYIALMATEGINVVFTESGIQWIAKAAFQANERTENIGARRLHTILEYLMEEISYNSDEFCGKTVSVDNEYVRNHLNEFVSDEDLSKFIL